MRLDIHKNVSSNGNGIYKLGQENPEDTSKLPEEVAHMSMIPPFAMY